LRCRSRCHRQAGKIRRSRPFPCKRHCAIAGSAVRAALGQALLPRRLQPLVRQFAPRCRSSPMPRAAGPSTLLRKEARTNTPSIRGCPAPRSSKRSAEDTGSDRRAPRPGQCRTGCRTPPWAAVGTCPSRNRHRAPDCNRRSPGGTIALAKPSTRPRYPVDKLRPGPASIPTELRARR
jgi:hypothetical protein